MVRKSPKRCLMPRLFYANRRRTCRCFKEMSSGCKKSSGGFTGYQRCELSVILLLEDHSDDHYTAKYPLIKGGEIKDLA